MMRSYGLKLCHWSFKFDIRKNFFSEKMVGNWHSLPREVAVTVPGDV